MNESGDCQKSSSDDHKVDKLWTNDDLIDLIRAVKFSNKNASMRQVHKEISAKMSTHPSFEFLSQVGLNDIKKVWKKALSGASTNQTGETNHDKSSLGSDPFTSALADMTLDDGKKKQKDKVIKFYTVGDGSVKMLAEDYTLNAASQLIAENAEKFNEEEDKQNYVHCFVDVPADKSGKSPYQALINFNTLRRNDKISNTNDREIVKIQVAADIPGIPKTPMLLYNASRSVKTFIHPDEDDSSEGYEKIKKMIQLSGSKGVLTNGGSKAYFYSRVIKQKKGPDVISIDVSTLAPSDQNW